MGIRNRSKYSDRVREDAVRAVREDHRSYCAVAREFSVGHNTVHRWVAQNASVPRFAGKSDYDAAFKLRVLQYRKENQLSLLETATVFGIGAESTILSWERLYAQHGIKGLRASKPRGRPPKAMGRPKKREPQTELEKLQAENAYLKAEVAFLKKVRALVEERITRESGRRPRRSKD